MNENLQNKVSLVSEIKDKLSRAKTVVFVDYKGTSVCDDTKMRGEFRKNGDDYKVYKNRLVLRALNELGLDGYDKYLEGTTAFAFGYEDEVSAAKVITESKKTNQNLTIKCGIFNGKFMDSAEVEKLGNLPNKETLIAQLLCVLNGPARNLACTLKAITEKE